MNHDQHRLHKPWLLLQNDTAFNFCCWYWQLTISWKSLCRGRVEPWHLVRKVGVGEMKGKRQLDCQTKNRWSVKGHSIYARGRFGCKHDSVANRKPKDIANHPSNHIESFQAPSSNDDFDPRVTSLATCLGELESRAWNESKTLSANADSGRFSTKGGVWRSGMIRRYQEDPDLGPPWKGTVPPNMLNLMDTEWSFLTIQNDYLSIKNGAMKVVIT